VKPSFSHRLILNDSNFVVSFDLCFVYSEVGFREEFGYANCASAVQILLICFLNYKLMIYVCGFCLFSKWRNILVIEFIASQFCFITMVEALVHFSH
jgi:hypothetical protein